MRAASYLDVLGEIGNARGYEDLAPRCVTIHAGPGVDVEVLGLDALIEARLESGRDKDLAVLPAPRATRDARRARAEAEAKAEAVVISGRAARRG